MQDFFAYERLRLAYERMIISSTKDVRNHFGQSLYKIKLKENLVDLGNRLNANEYQPSRPFKYYEPKSIGTQRVKTVLSIEDSVVYQAITNYIAEEVYEELDETKKFVFGNILHENVPKGTAILDEFNPDFRFFKPYAPLFNEFVNSVNKQVEEGNSKFKLDTDITGFFDSIPHSSLAFILQEKGIDRQIIELLLLSLNVWSGTRNSPTFQVGIPQGPIASFFIANLLLHDLDKIMVREAFSYYRYTDDIKIYSDSKSELEKALVIIDLFLKDHSLSINSKKTLIEKISDNKEEEVKKALKNQSLKELILTDDEISGIESEYFEEYTSQDENDFLMINIPSEDIKRIIKKRLSKLESEIYSTFNKHIVNNVFDFEDIGKHEDELLNYVYLWRKYLNILSDYTDNIDLNKDIISIWIAGLNTYYWRANHFCWNLSRYKFDAPTKLLMQEINTKYKRFEWVRYQINILAIKSWNIEQTDIQEYIKKLKKEDSPLVRLSLFKILIHHVKENSQLEVSVQELIKNDIEPYIKYTLTDWLLFTKNNTSSLNIIKSWFSL